MEESRNSTGVVNYGKDKTLITCSLGGTTHLILSSMMGGREGSGPGGRKKNPKKKCSRSCCKDIRKGGSVGLSLTGRLHKT